MFRSAAISEPPAEPFEAFVAVVLRLVGILSRAIDLLARLLLSLSFAKKGLKRAGIPLFADGIAAYPSTSSRSFSVHCQLPRNAL